MRLGKWKGRRVFSLLCRLSPVLACRYYYGVRGEKIECYVEGKHQGDGTDTPLTVNGELFTGIMFNQGYKDVRYYQNGHIHRADGPAIEWPGGSKEWFIEGIRHRLNGPAAENPSGSKEWWVEDKLHRLDGPAVEMGDGDKYWYANHALHRLDGPAVQIYTGTKSALNLGKLIRLYRLNPVSPDCYTAWWVDGKNVDIVSILGYEPSVPLTDDEQVILRLSV